MHRQSAGGGRYSGHIIYGEAGGWVAVATWRTTVVRGVSPVDRHCCDVMFFIVTQVAQHASMHALAPLWDPGHWTGRPPVQSLQDWELANR